jgi:hypothetical protein
MSGLRGLRLRHVLIALISAAVGLTTVTSLFGLGEGGSHSQPPPDRVPRVLEYALVTSATLDATADPRGGAPVSVVASPDIVVSARVEGVKELLVAVYECGACPAKTFSAKPDESGAVLVSLRLPESNKVFVVEGIGLIDDKLIVGWEGDYYNNRPAVSAGEPLRVMAKP